MLDNSENTTLCIINNALQRSTLVLFYPALHDSVDNEIYHVLEHILILFWSSFASNDSELWYYINGITLGSGIMIVIESHADQFLSLVEEFVNIYTTCDFSFDEKALEREKNIIAIENNSAPENAIVHEWLSKYYCGKKTKPLRSMILDDLFYVYNTMIAWQQPLIILQNSLIATVKERKKINRLVENKLQHHILSKVTMSSNYIPARTQIDEKIKYYEPHIAVFMWSTSKKIGLYMSLPEIKKYNMLAYSILLHRLLGELLFEYIRLVEGTDYEVSHAPRVTPWAYEFAWVFRTASSSDTIVDMVENIFYLDEEKFLALQQKTYYDQLCRQDNMYDTSYWIIQHYLKYGRFWTIKDSAESVKNISFSDFVDFYNTYCVPNISLEILRW